MTEELLTQSVWKNKKNQKMYVVLGRMINATNAQDGQLMVRYRPVPYEDGAEYCRSREEFLEKFERA